MNSVLPRSIACSIACDLRRIGAVQDVEARPASLPSERFAEHLGAEARAAHPQQHDVGEAALLHVASQRRQPRDVGQFLLDDVQPAEPFVLVGPGPQRCVASPKPPNPPSWRQSSISASKAVFISGRARADLQAGAIAVQHCRGAAARRRRTACRTIGELLHAFGRPVRP